MSAPVMTLTGPREELAGEDLSRAARGTLSDLGADAPERLYVVGDPAALEEVAVSVIGARRATPYGLTCARLAARVGARLGLCVVSGAAVGCDQAAQDRKSVV